MALKVEDYRFVPLDVLATPRDGETLTDRWWLVHPEKGAAFYKAPGRRSGYSPQCNHDRRIGGTIGPRCGFDAEIVFIPCAFVGRHDPEWGYLLSGIGEVRDV